MFTQIRLLAFVALCALAAGLAAGAAAQETPPAEPAGEAVAPPDPQRSPRALVAELVNAVDESAKAPERLEDAAALLDFSSVADSERTDEAALRAARELALLIERVFRARSIKLETIPDEAAARAERLRSYQIDVTETVGILLDRDADGQWRFSAETVANLPSIVQAFERETDETPQDAAPSSTAPPGRRTPRATMKSFLEAVNDARVQDAARCLDLSQLPAATRTENGRRLALRLKLTLDRIGVVELLAVPDHVVGAPYLHYASDKGRIEIARTESEERKDEWLFTPATVASVETLFLELEDQPLKVSPPPISMWQDPGLWTRLRVPTAFKERAFGLELWQWLGLIPLLVLTVLTRIVGSIALAPLAAWLLRPRDAMLMPAVVRRAVHPTSWFISLWLLWIGVQFLDPSTTTINYFWPPIKLLLTTAGVWAIYRLIDLVVAKLASHWGAIKASRLDEVLVPLTQTLLKVFVFVFGAVVIVRAVTGSDQITNNLLASIGIGGLAIGLAAQDTLKNLFGLVNIVLDRPFQVGDWIKLGSTEGTVEVVGIRSSRIRTFYNSQITVPNSELMNATIDNMGRRQYRRISIKLGVLYSTTPARLEAFCEGIRELIREHPYTRKDSYHVYVNDFSASSIDILLYCFLETPDWGTELRERHRLFVDIVRLAQQLGVVFAFPTQTVHLHHDTSPDTPADPGPEVPGWPADAMAHGAGAARSIVHEYLGPDPATRKPPPVAIPAKGGDADGE